MGSIRLNKKITEYYKSSTDDQKRATNFWYEIGKETDKSILVELWYEYVDGTKIQNKFEKSCWTSFWLPKSQVEVKNDTIEIPEWLYYQKVHFDIN